MIIANLSSDFHILKTVLGIRNWLFCEKLRNSWLPVDRVGIEKCKLIELELKMQSNDLNWKSGEVLKSAGSARQGRISPTRPPLDRNIQIPMQWAFKLDQIFPNGILQSLPRVSGKGFIIEQSNHQVSLTRLSFGSFDFHWTLNLKITFKSLRPC